jgi:hypothetical protein
MRRLVDWYIVTDVSDFIAICIFNLLVTLSHIADDMNLGHHRCKILVSQSAYVSGGNRRPFTVSKNIWGSGVVKALRY